MDLALRCRHRAGVSLVPQRGRSVFDALCVLWRSFDARSFRACVGVLNISYVGDELLIAFLPSFLLLLLFVLLLLLRFARASHKHVFRLTWPWLLVAVCVLCLTSSVDVMRRCLTITLCFLFAAGLMLHFLPRNLSRPIARFSQRALKLSFLAFVASLVISLAVYLGNGETAITATRTTAELFQLNRFAALLAALVALLQILSLVGLGRILQSGRDDAPPWQRTVYRTLTWTLCIAPVFVVVHWMARENISHFATHRPPTFEVDDIQQWPAFIAMSEPGGALHFLADAPSKKEATSFEQERAFQSELDRLQGEDSWEQWERRPTASLGEMRRKASWVAGLLLPGENATAVYSRQWKVTDDARRAFLEHLGLRHRNGEAGRIHLEESEVTFRLVEMIKKQSTTRGDVAPSPGSETASSVLAVKPGAKQTADIAPSRALTEATVFLEKRATEMREGQHLMALWTRALPFLAAPWHDPAEPSSERSLPWRQPDVASLNRLLLEALLPEIIRERTMVSTPIVIQSDQDARWHWLAWWSGILGVTFLLVSFNHLAPFYWFYRHKLRAYFVRLSSGIDYPLHDTDCWKSGFAYPLLMGTLLLRHRIGSPPVALGRENPGKGDRPRPAKTSALTSGELNTEMRTHPFLFSPRYCGCPFSGYRQTNQYCDGMLHTMDAVAISGSAFTPQVLPNIPLRLMLTAFNLRLGQWMPNPQPNRQPRGLTGAFPWQLLWEAFRPVIGSTENWRLGFVADGGLHNNLARRNCCADAAG